MTIICITAIDPIASLYEEYIKPFGSEENCRAEIDKAFRQRPIKNKGGMTVEYNKFNKDLDCLAWLVHTSWTEIMYSLHAETNKLLEPYNGKLLHMHKDGKNYETFIDLGSLPQEKEQMYMASFEDMIQSLNDTMRHVRIKTVSEVRAPIPDASIKILENDLRTMAIQGFR